MKHLKDCSAPYAASSMSVVDTLIQRYGVKNIEFHLHFRAAHKFLEATDENREMAAYAARRARESWPHSFPLSEVCTYLMQRPHLNEHLMRELASLSDTQIQLLKIQLLSEACKLILTE